MKRESTTENRRRTRSTTAAKRQAWKLTILDAVAAELIRYLPPFAAINLAATCSHLRIAQNLKFVSKQDKSIDFSELLDTKRCNMSDLFIQRVLSGGMDNITRIDVQWCRKLTDATFKTIVAACPAATSLNTASCSALTDEKRARPSRQIVIHLRI